MAIIRKKIENLKAGQDYILSVQAKNSDLNISNDPLAAIRFTVPRDGTVPAVIQNLELRASFQNVQFIFDFGQEEDISHYIYELYSANEATEANLVSSGINPANVFTVSVENSSQAAGGSPVWRDYWGRVKAVDTSGNESDWTSLVQTDESTPLIDEQYISSLTASKITAGTIGAHTITLSGANSILQSSNFSTGSTGWQIKGDGTAEFDSQYIRGDLNAGSVTIGNGTYNYWNKTGQENDFRVGDASTYLLWDNSEGTLTVAGNASISGTLNSVDGTFTGTLSAVGGTFSGTLSGVGGTFTTNVTVGSHATNKITIASDSTSTGTKIYSGTGTYNNTDTGFYMDASGRFSLKDKFSWDGTNITLNGTTATSDLEINGAIVTGGIIRTNSDTDNNDAVAIQEDRIYIYNRGGGAGEIRFESDNSSDISKIVASTGGVSFECDSQTGDATFINGASSSRPEFNWKGWGATFASLYQNTSSGGLAVFSLGGSSSSYIQSNNFYIAQNGGTSALPLRFSNDTDTGIYRYSDGSTGTGLGLVANGTLIFTAHTTNSNGTGPSLYMNAPATTTTSGYRFLLRSTTFGGVAEFASNRYLKDNIQTFDYSGFIMDSLNPIKYVPSYLGEDEELEQDKILRENDIQHGFIAEDISQVMGGILATFDENLNPTGWRWPDLIAICVAEIKSLRSRVAQLESL